MEYIRRTSKFNIETNNSTLKFSLKGPVRTHHYLNTYIRYNMEPQTMTNEQFALWIATQMIHSNLFETADAVYEWLENKRSNSEYDIFEAMGEKKIKNEG